VIDRFADSPMRTARRRALHRLQPPRQVPDLLATARDLGAAALATGHYVRAAPGRTPGALFQPADADRDQSYFLFATTPTSSTSCAFRSAP
jgi:tRNA-specific 2-thiouridylase